MNQLDNYFNKNYNSLLIIAKGINYRHQRKNLDPSDVVSRAYELVKEKYSSIIKEDEIQRITIAIIRNLIAFNKSSLVIENTYLDCEQLNEQIKEEVEEINLEDECKIQNQRYKLHTYLSECNLVNRVFLLEYIKGKRTVRDLAKHYKIGIGGAHRLLTEIKKEINEL